MNHLSFVPSSLRRCVAASPNPQSSIALIAPSTPSADRVPSYSRWRHAPRPAHAPRASAVTSAMPKPGEPGAGMFSSINEGKGRNARKKVGQTNPKNRTGAIENAASLQKRTQSKPKQTHFPSEYSLTPAVRFQRGLSVCDAPMAPRAGAWGSVHLPAPSRSRLGMDGHGSEWTVAVRNGPRGLPTSSDPPCPRFSAARARIELAASDRRGRSRQGGL